MTLAEESYYTLERYAARTSLRRSSEDEHLSMEENIRQLETIALDRKGKKTSKLKKFFKKLSNKKDSKSENENSGHRERIPSTEAENNRLSTVSSNYDMKGRRRSDGTISLYSVNEVNNVHPTTPLTKRRLFAINLSFMKRGRRQRSNTTVLNTSDGSNKSTRPSDTIRALCSPDMTRRSQFTELATSGRRASDPSIFRLQHNSTSTPLRFQSHKKYRAPQPPNKPTPSTTTTYTFTPTTLTTLITTTATTTTTVANNKRPAFFPRVSHSSVSSDGGEGADYINYPFSKANVKAPQKPSRKEGGKGSGSDPYSNHNRSNSIGGSSKSSSNNDGEYKKDNYRHHKRHSVTSDDSIVMSSESLSSSQGTNGDVFELTPASAASRANSSLRRTPLRNSIDSYNKLLEVHRQTIDKIAFEVSRLVCDCEQLNASDWNDFDRKDEVIQLGTGSYMVVPVTCNKSDNKKNYTAWLRLDQQHSSTSPKPTKNDSPTHINYSKSTLHRNCLHICHSIEPAYATPFEESLPKAIEVNSAYISSQVPKMTLSKYIGMTMEKHTRYPEAYEREAALILLQIVKGITHLMKKRVQLKSITSDNVFILNSGDPSIVLSPRREPNKCPAVVVAYLPGLGDSCTTITTSDNITNICHQLAFLLYELLHSPYQEELRSVVNSPMLFSTLPDLTIKSIYSRYLQSIIDKLLGATTHNANSLDDLRLTLEIFLFGPTDICDHEEKEGVSLIQKWHNRRCVDMVAHILKEAPLIMLCASEHRGQEVERIKTIDQEILLECEFLSTVMPIDMYKISKELRR